MYMVAKSKLRLLLAAEAAATMDITKDGQTAHEFYFWS